MNEEDKADSEDNFSDWEDDDEEHFIVRSLFSDSEHTNIKSFLQYDKDTYDFDLSAIVSASKYDDIRLIMLVKRPLKILPSILESLKIFMQKWWGQGRILTQRKLHSQIYMA